MSYLFLALFLSLAIGLVFFHTDLELNQLQRIGGGVIAIILMLGWVLVQRKRDRWLTATLERIQLSDEESFYLLFSNSPVAHIILDRSGKIANFNPATAQLLKTKLHALSGRSFVTLCAPEFDTSILAQKLRAGITINELELPLITDEGMLVWTLLSVSSLLWEEKLLITMVDITDQKKVDTAKSEFVALATHQLRTPIAAIRYATELLGRRLADGATERNAAYIDKIDRNVVRMLSLIDDFLNVSKLEMGTFATEPSRLNMSEFVTGVLDELGDRMLKQRITATRSDTPTDLWFITDPRLLNIILTNLISNAVKYTPEGGKIHVAFTGTSSSLRFEISDSGIGIPAAEIPQLFSKFFRASNARTIQTEGTGLGLYIVAQALQKLGGTIEVDSRVGEGTSFVVTIASL